MRRWRRTAFRRIDGAIDIAFDDWCLQDSNNQTLARIYKVAGGPHDSMWFWAVQVGPDGEARNGGTGYSASGNEAREICEALTDGVTAKPPARTTSG